MRVPGTAAPKGGGGSFDGEMMPAIPASGKTGG
jgi:hypothetical protein